MLKNIILILVLSFCLKCVCTYIYIKCTFITTCVIISFFYTQFFHIIQIFKRCHEGILKKRAFFKDIFEIYIVFLLLFLFHHIFFQDSVNFYSDLSWKLAYYIILANAYMRLYLSICIFIRLLYNVYIFLIIPGT